MGKIARNYTDVFDIDMRSVVPGYFYFCLTLLYCSTPTSNHRTLWIVVINPVRVARSPPIPNEKRCPFRVTCTGSVPVALCQ